ncbi:MAG TPA: ATP cone domain-containing protein [Mycobacteriales bacterium]|nr:ATP cone domain-containing protein [Mycobacteriales bacterium]
MNCPYCDGATRVTDSRPEHGRSRVRRRRSCTSCGEQFTTYEGISADGILVHKRGDRRTEQFSRTKLRRGIEKAAAGWTLQDVDRFVTRVVERIRPEPGVPITSARIAELVLRVLEGEDPATNVTRIRYAMVLIGRRDRPGGFVGIREFLAWLEDEYGPAPAEPPPAYPAIVRKDNGGTEHFDREKISRSVGLALKGRGTEAQVRALTATVVGEALESLGGQAIVTTQQVAGAVLPPLIQTDPIAYLRYASATKRYQSVEDFWAEALALAQAERPMGNTA